MKKMGIYAFLIAFSILTGCSLKEKSEYVFKIDGYEIGQKQFDFYIEENRSNIINEYQNEQELINNSFWEKEVSKGCTVLDKLKEAAQKQCVYEHMVLLMAKEKGLIKSISFEEIEESLEVENKRRDTAIQKGEVIYGNKSYNMNTYMNYYLSNLTRELIRIMEERELKYTEEELRQYCIENGKDVDDLEDKRSIEDLYGFEMKNFLFKQYVLKKVRESCIEINEKYINSQ